ncbi:hypothetical protein ACFYPC_13025 [Streptomyces sp. NPDC005808]|uniref:hypothetical protein n=1 Tax=Streptomyces sp. NPDC005808 TaxID=3364734 RepID=UPI00369D704D
METTDRGKPMSHKDCGHPKTRAAREKRRRDRGQVSPSQTPEARRAVSQAKPKPEPKIRDTKGHPWKGSPLTAPVLSGMIYKRMRANRDRRYVFDREWLYRQLPHVSTELVDMALQYLVDKGKISGIPK